MMDLIRKRVDAFGRNHLVLTMLFTFILGVLATLALLTQIGLGGNVILYEGF